MVVGGNATIFITNMDVALKFYTEILGLKLNARYGDHWATVEAGVFTIGLHPKSVNQAAPGTSGSIVIGLTIDEPIEVAAAKLKLHNVKMLHGIERGEGGNFVSFHDPDGNELYLWEVPKQE